MCWGGENAVTVLLIGESSVVGRMGKNVVTRRELLDRWRVIEAEDDDEDVDHHFQHQGGGKRRRLHLLKEAWFVFLFIFPNWSYDRAEEGFHFEIYLFEVFRFYLFTDWVNIPLCFSYFI